MKVLRRLYHPKLQRCVAEVEDSDGSIRWRREISDGVIDGFASKAEVADAILANDPKPLAVVVSAAKDIKSQDERLGEIGAVLLHIQEELRKSTTDRDTVIRGIHAVSTELRQLFERQLPGLFRRLEEAQGQSSQDLISLVQDLYKDAERSQQEVREVLNTLHEKLAPRTEQPPQASQPAPAAAPPPQLKPEPEKQEPVMAQTQDTAAAQAAPAAAPSQSASAPATLAAGAAQVPPPPPPPPQPQGWQSWWTWQSPRVKWGLGAVVALVALFWFFWPSSSERSLAQVEASVERILKKEISALPKATPGLTEGQLKSAIKEGKDAVVEDLIPAFTTLNKRLLGVEAAQHEMAKTLAQKPPAQTPSATQPAPQAPAATQPSSKEKQSGYSVRDVQVVCQGLEIKFSTPVEEMSSADLAAAFDQCDKVRTAKRQVPERTTTALTSQEEEEISNLLARRAGRPQR